MSRPSPRQLAPFAAAACAAVLGACGGGYAVDVTNDSQRDVRFLVYERTPDGDLQLANSLLGPGGSIQYKGLEASPNAEHLYALFDAVPDDHPALKRTLVGKGRHTFTITDSPEPGGIAVD